MNKSTQTVARLNLKNIKTAYWLAGIMAGVMALQSITMYVLSRFGINVNGNVGVSVSGPAEVTSWSIGIGWYAWLLVLIAAIVVARPNFDHIINLGGKRLDYLRGTILAYAGLTAAASLVVITTTYAMDRPLTRWGVIGGYLSAPDVFGWSAHGPVVAFLQQWAFLLLFAAFVHTLVAALDKWYGWTAAALIVAIISVFTPIAPLRHAEAWFFHLILLAQPVAQIAACVILAAVVYYASKPVLDRRAV